MVTVSSTSAGSITSSSTTTSTEVVRGMKEVEDEENLSLAGKYACSMWYYHVRDAVDDKGGLIEEDVLLRWINLMEKIADQWFLVW